MNIRRHRALRAASNIAFWALIAGCFTVCAVTLCAPAAINALVGATVATFAVWAVLHVAAEATRPVLPPRPAPHIHRPAQILRQGAAQAANTAT